MKERANGENVEERQKGEERSNGERQKGEER